MSEAFEKIPCNSCGKYYGHSKDCQEYLVNTGIAERIAFEEVKQRYENKLYHAEQEITELKKQIEYMKNCENCKHFTVLRLCNEDSQCKFYDKWQLAE